MKSGVAPHAGMLSRGEAAKYLGITRDAVRKADRNLKPIKDADGQWWYEVGAVERYRLHTDAKRDNPAYQETQNETAARAFELFEGDRSPAEVVIALGLHPAAVRKLWEDWTEMSEHGQKAAHAREMVKIRLETARSQARAERYRDYNEYRLKEKELQLEIAKEYARGARFRAEVTGNERIKRLPAPGSTLPVPSYPKKDLP